MKSFLKSVVAVVSLFFGSTTVFADTVLKVSLQLPSSHPLGQNWQDFQTIIEEKSQGALSLELFPSGELFKDDEIASAVSIGDIDAGSVFLGQYAEKVPAVRVVSLPFLFDDTSAIQQAVSPGSSMRELLDQAILEATNTRVLWWQALGRNVFLSTGDPLTTPGGVHDKTVRIYGQVQGWTVDALGGKPELISGHDQYKAYKDGSVQAGMTHPSVIEARKLFEVTDSMTLTYDSAIEFVAVINNDVFEGLSEADQTILMDAAKIVETRLRSFMYASEDTLVDKLSEHMSVIWLTQTQRNLWQAATAQVSVRFARDADELGLAVLKAAREAN